MSKFYKFYLDKGIQKIINLNHVSSIILQKNIIELNYKTNNYTGFLVFGTGVFESNNTEKIDCQNEKEALNVFEDIFKKLKED
jgi:hypothetical protein